MKTPRFVTVKELGPVATALNIRFAGFLVRLAEVEGLDPNKVVEDARQILADAEIAQEG